MSTKSVIRNGKKRHQKKPQKTLETLYVVEGLFFDWIQNYSVKYLVCKPEIKDCLLTGYKTIL